MTSPLGVTRLGFGVTGPHATPAVSRAHTVALATAAVAAGVRVFDTGPMYGGGEAELRLGMALAALNETGVARERLFIMTKARTWPMRPEPGAARLSPSQRVRTSLDLSLERLGTSHVDTLFLHGPAPGDFTPDLMETLADLRTAGLVRHLGVCGRGPELDAALACGGFECLMMPVAGQRALLSRAAAHGVSVFAIETMRARASPWRIPANGADLWYLARAARDALAGTSVTEDTGIAAALGLPAVTCVIAQTTRLEHLRDNARAAGVA